MWDQNIMVTQKHTEISSEHTEGLCLHIFTLPNYLWMQPCGTMQMCVADRWTCVAVDVYFAALHASPALAVQLSQRSLLVHQLTYQTGGGGWCFTGAPLVHECVVVSTGVVATQLVQMLLPWLLPLLSLPLQLELLLLQPLLSLLLLFILTLPLTSEASATVAASSAAVHTAPPQRRTSSTVDARDFACLLNGIHSCGAPHLFRGKCCGQITSLMQI